MPKETKPEDLAFLSKIQETITRRLTLELTLDELEKLTAFYFAKHFEFSEHEVVVEIGDKYAYIRASRTTEVVR